MTVDVMAYAAEVPSTASFEWAQTHGAYSSVGKSSGFAPKALRTIRPANAGLQPARWRTLTRQNCC